MKSLGAPKLRFPEFRDQPEWEVVALGEIAEIKLGKMLDGKKNTTGRLLPYLNNLAVRWNEVDTSNLPEMYFDEDEFDRYGLLAGDVVVCEGGEPGRAALWDGRLPDLKFQKAIHRVRFHAPFAPRLLVIYLESIAGSTQFEKLFTGGGIKHLTRETFSQLNIPLIPSAEQTKIVECLSTLDELIVATRQKLDVLKAHKKGLMQQLFPREGETLPRLRFPGFQAGPWAEVLLSELVASLEAGISVNGGDRPAEDGEVGVLRTSAVADGLFHPNANKVVDDSYERARLSGPVLANTIIVSRSNTPELVGSCAYVGNDISRLFLSDKLWAAKPRAKVSMQFLAFLLSSTSGRVALTTLATGTSGSMKNISKSDFLNMRIRAPGYDEQQRIASCLSSFDDLIDAEKDRLEALKTHKKGLMQQLFPSPTEAVE